MIKNKMTWCELSDYLRKNHDKVGVVVFKQHPNWKREFSEEERSYLVSGNNKFFYDNMISCSIWASNIPRTDEGVRLDWYMFYEDKENRWKVDYCYLLED